MDTLWQQQQDEQEEREDSECAFYYQVEQQHEFEVLKGNPAPIKSGLLGE